MAGAIVQGATLDLPSRPDGAPTGSAFLGRIAGLSLAEREEAIVQEVASGNIPDFLRQLRPIAVTNVVDGKPCAVVFEVTPDYLAVGSDADYCLLPISPNASQRIAEALHCVLPTPRMVDAIYQAAEVKLAPIPIPPSAAMTTVAVFSNHNAFVRTQRLAQLPQHPPGALVAGHKKDVVITPRLAQSPGKVAIYGWHQTNGVAIQPLYLGHTAAWVDYSQCARLVLDQVTIGGTNRGLAEVLADPLWAHLLSDEGPIAQARYATNQVSVAEATNQPGAKANPPPKVSGFRSTGEFGERVAEFEFEPEVRILINAPPTNDFAFGRPITLVIFALPNGNTIEQTLGRKLAAGDDWHFDIQHIGAQTRYLRDLLRDQAIVVAYLEAGQKSWPAWRRKNGDKLIPEIVEAVKRTLPGSRFDLVFTGHSGGGSLTFGYLNAISEIPKEVQRIAFLDSNYAYDGALGQREKLATWLRADTNHALLVLAYNDAVALLDGKPFVSAAGGTWGKSHEMQRDLAKEFSFISQTNGGFETYKALDGRVQFLLKENPERKVLHTVQVERNGFIHAMLFATPNESRGYEYFGPRAYTNWVSPSPSYQSK